MYKFSLKFVDKELEEKYQNSVEFERIHCIFCLIRIEIFFSVVCIGYSLLRNYSFEYLISLIAIGILLLILVIVKLILPKILKTVLFISFFGFSILFIEIINQMKSNDYFTENGLILAIPLQLFTYAILLTKSPWYQCAFFFFLESIYLTIRLFDWSDFSQKDYIIISLAFSLISYSYMSYQLEKTYRQFYKSIYESDKSLTHFKLLVQNIMPNPIFIVNYEKSSIDFFNKSAFDILSKKNYPFDTVDPVISTENLLDYRSRSSINFFSAYEFFMSKIRTVNENKIMLESKFSDKISVADTLKDFYKQNDVQNFDKYNIFKNNSLEFLSLNVISEDYFDCDEEKKRFFEIKFAKIFWENHSCLLVLLNDNTNLRKILELQNLDDYKNKLLATVSHDLRTPLHGLIGIFDIVIPQIMDPEIKRNLIIGLRSANLLLYMINDILDFSQMIYKRIRLNIEKVDIKEIVQETAELIEFQAKRKNINFIVNYKAFIPQYLFTDGNRIKQILINLLSNSLKFTQNGFIKLTIKGFSHKNKVKFSVTDSGVGIQKTDQNKLFKLFSKLDQQDPTINKTGVGLGLTISQNLVKLLNGSNHEEMNINVKSSLGKGSKFWFFVRSLENEEENVFSVSENLKIHLPFSQSYSNNLNNLSSCNFNESHQQLLFKKSTNRIETIEKVEKYKKVLIVDDDPLNILIAQNYMHAFGLPYLVANNGKEAVEIVENDIINERNEISIILMDVNMPILDGLQASAQILEFLREKGAEELVIIAITANVDIADQEKCFEAGMKRILTKPVKKKDLEMLLREYLEF